MALRGLSDSLMVHVIEGMLGWVLGCPCNFQHGNLDCLNKVFTVTNGVNLRVFTVPGPARMNHICQTSYIA